MKVLISGLKPGMRISARRGTATVVALRDLYESANGRIVYTWTVKWDNRAYRNNFFMGCGDLTVDVEDNNVNA